MKKNVLTVDGNVVRVQFVEHMFGVRVYGAIEFPISNESNFQYRFVAHKIHWFERWFIYELFLDIAQYTRRWRASNTIEMVRW